MRDTDIAIPPVDLSV